MTKTQTISQQTQYELLHATLSERDWRIYLGTEARKLGNISQVAKVSGSDRKTIARGVIDSNLPPFPDGRVRLPGGGRKKLLDTDPTLKTYHSNLPPSPLFVTL